MRAAIAPMTRPKQAASMVMKTFADSITRGRSRCAYRMPLEKPAEEIWGS